MSLFSSLTYLLKKLFSAFNQTGSLEPPLNLKLKEFKSLNGSVSSTINTTSYSKYLHFMLDPGNFSDETETNNSYKFLLSETLTNFISLPTSVSKLYLETENYTSESKVQFPNETNYNADFLHESWWNVFDERYLRHGWGWTITLVIAYLTILVVGVIGNVMVILVVSLRPQMRTVTNMFIMNLAVADLFVVVFCVPSTLLANIFVTWILGSFMCKAVAYVQGVSVCASAYSLAAISLDRCQAVYRNYERPQGFSQKIFVITVIMIWTGAISLTIPWAVVFKDSEYDGLCYCVETWAVEKHGNIYFLLVNLVIFYAIPLLLIFVSNWIIYCHVMHRHVPQDSASSAPLRKMHLHTRHVVLRMLGIVTLTFFLCWLPLYVLVIGIKFSESITESEYNLLGILVPIAQWLGSWNSSINPILYAFLNKKFRRMFKSILPAWIPVKSTGPIAGYMKTPSFVTTANTGRSLARSRTNSRSDEHRHTRNGRKNTHHYPSNLSIGRFEERPREIARNTVQFITSTIPATAILLNGGLENVFHKVIARKSTTETITDV